MSRPAGLIGLSGGGVGGRRQTNVENFPSLPPQLRASDKLVEALVACGSLGPCPSPLPAAAPLAPRVLDSFFGHRKLNENLDAY
jgi:hypothetical protein